MNVTFPEHADATWHKSSYSGGDNNCVERGVLAGGRQAVRDTKNRQRGALHFGAEAWQRFVDALRADSLSG